MTGEKVSERIAAHDGPMPIDHPDTDHLDTDHLETGPFEAFEAAGWERQAAGYDAFFRSVTTAAVGAPVSYTHLTLPTKA